MKDKSKRNGNGGKGYEGMSVIKAIESVGAVAMYENGKSRGFATNTNI